MTSVITKSHVISVIYVHAQRVPGFSKCPWILHMLLLGPFLQWPCSLGEPWVRILKCSPIHVVTVWSSITLTQCLRKNSTAAETTAYRDWKMFSEAPFIIVITVHNNLMQYIALPCCGWVILNLKKTMPTHNCIKLLGVTIILILKIKSIHANEKK